VASDILDRMKVTSGCIDDIRLVLSEACTNVIRHAATDDDYEVRLWVDDRTCTIEVHDAGAQLDLAGRGRKMARRNARRGRGLAIMDNLTDELDFTSDPRNGTTVRLAKHLIPRVSAR
jgi:serine/threonine-protein kinase RsbW